MTMFLIAYKPDSGDRYNHNPADHCIDSYENYCHPETELATNIAHYLFENSIAQFDDSEWELSVIIDNKLYDLECDKFRFQNEQTVLWNEAHEIFEMKKQEHEKKIEDHKKEQMHASLLRVEAEEKATLAKLKKKYEGE